MKNLYQRTLTSEESSLRKVSGDNDFNLNS